jgi:hypothetical protein
MVIIVVDDNIIPKVNTRTISHPVLKYRILVKVFITEDGDDIVLY